MRCALTLFWILACLAWPPGSSAANGRDPTRPGLSVPPSLSLKRALVIGNGAYAAGMLPNARADAVLIAGALKKNGFDVTLATDLTRSAMFDAVQAYSAALPKGAISVVYFAGHGMQVEGLNYLLPVDMVPTSAATVGRKSFPVKIINEQLAAAPSRVNIVILDACRNNPFEPAPAVRMRSLGAMGLAPVSIPRGTLIAYSTAPGQQAADGDGRRHSLYAETLAELLDQKKLTVEELFKTLADQVRRQSLEDQQPWYESSLIGNVTLSAPVGDSPVDTGPDLRTPPVATRTRAVQGTPRGSIGHEGDAAWYRTLSELELTELDYTMTQRAVNTSQDQVPALLAQAKRNNVVAMTTLAMMLRAGTRSGIDVQTGRRFRSDPQMANAMQWYRKAAALGFPVAQVELAELLYRGKETEANKTEALRWFALAAETNYPRARIDLAQTRAEQTGSPADMQSLIEHMVGGTRSMQEQIRARQN